MRKITELFRSNVRKKGAERLGIEVLTVGVLIGIGGFALTYIELEQFGRVVFVLGWIVAALGLSLTFIAKWLRRSQGTETTNSAVTNILRKRKRADKTRE